MNNSIYIYIAIVWLVICAALSLYIIGKGMTAKQQFSIGLKSIFISFLIGVSFLLLAITSGIK